MNADLAKRIAITVLLAAGVLVAGRAPIPGIDPQALLSIGVTDQVGILTLGLGPVISAFVLVEIAALLIPSWRRRRHGSAVDRATLTRAAMWLAAGLAVLQGAMIAVGLTRMNTPMGPLVENPGMAFVLFTTLTLAAGSFLIVWVASLISRFGIANGFAAILSVGVIYAVAGVFWMMWSLFQLGEVSLLGALILLCVHVGVVALAGIVFRQRGATPLPASGLVPINLFAGLALFVATFLTFSEFTAQLASVVRPGSWIYESLQVAFVVVFTPLFVRLFHPPARMAALHQRPVPLIRPVVLTMAFLLALAFLSLLGQQIGSLGLVVPLVAAVAAVEDVMREARMRAAHPDLVSVWPLHALYAIEPVVDALGAAGIPAHPRGVHFRSLFQFFAPYLPVEILVPRASAEEAERIVRDVLARTGASGEQLKLD